VTPVRSRSNLPANLLGQLRGVADWSISRKLVALTLLLSLVPLVVLTFLFTNQSSDALSSSARESLQQQALTSTEVLNNAIDKAAQDTLLLTTSDFLYSQSVGSGTKQDFLTQHDNIWGYGDIAVFTTEGKLLAGTGENYTDQAEEAYFGRVRELPAGQVYFSDIAIDAATGKVAVQVAAPAYNPAGVQLGVVRVLWTAESLQRIMADIASAGDNVTVDLINAQKTIVASTNPADVGKDYSASTSANEAVSGTSGSAVERLTTTIDGKDVTDSVITGHAPIRETERLAGLGWGVVVHQNEAEALNAVQEQRVFAVILLFVAAALVIGAGYLFSRRLVRPIVDLASVAQRVGAGDVTARATVENRDEVGQTGLAINQMLDDLSALIQTKEERDALQSQITKLLMEVSEVAEGDLTVEAEVTADALGSVADSFNYMIEQLRKIISNVNETTIAVSASSSQILSTSSALARSSQEQATQITETSTAIEEMATSIRQVSSNANLSAEVAREAQLNAQAGSRAVTATIEGMQRIRVEVQETSRTIKRLGESSQEIGQIIQIIEEIANQTNLLALNAAIQAAMAGEHGRGFAVVAEEVRRLAERAAGATKQVSNLVASIQAETADAVVSMDDSTREVVSGSRLADEAGTALTKIDGVVGRLSELIEAISQSADQQARASEEIARSMQDISEVTQTTTAGTTQAADSVSHLAGLAERLRQSVSTFKLHRNQGDATDHGTQSWGYGSVPAGDGD
jgi:methyl-accepting chemotaxis protein